MKVWSIISVIFLATSAFAQMPAPGEGRLDFLVGHWEITGGRFVAIGGRPFGTSDITHESGAVLIRDHSILHGVEGQIMGTHDSATFLYLDGGKLHADYTDGSSTVHYSGEIVGDGHEIKLTSEPSRSPTVLIDYVLRDPDTLEVTFGHRVADTGEMLPFLTEMLSRKQAEAPSQK